MVLWLIGVFFVWGLIAEDEPGFWCYAAAVPFWPLILGLVLRETLWRTK